MDKLFTRDIRDRIHFRAMFTAIAAAFTLGGCASAHEGGHGVAQEETANTPSATSIRSVSVLERAWLSEHNVERARLGLKPLVWDTNLSADAARHAVKMARSGTFEHADQRNNKVAQGENLWMGTIGAYNASDMVGSWIEERTAFRPGIFPNVSKTGNWADIGHYTQLIWPDTKRVGCALAGNSSDEYLVCRYYPAGNVLGEKIGVK
jgi:hypothetical protein